MADRRARPGSYNRVGLPHTRRGDGLPRPRRRSNGFPWTGVLLVSAAAALAVAPLSPLHVERAYSSGAYLWLQRILTSVSNLFPFALFDVLLAATVAAWLIAFGIDLARARGSWARMALRLAGRTVVWSAGFYLAFLLIWGLNYRRVPLAEKLQFDADRVSPAGAAALAATAVHELNTLHDAAHASGWFALTAINRQLAASFDRRQRELGATTAAVAGRPKTTLLEPYFRRAGVAGMTDPYFLETLVESELLPFERPFVVAHEWAHLAGYADESEANFVGWLSCVRGSTGDQYSGWLFLYEELTRAVRPADRAALSARLAPGPRADLEAIADRLRRQVSPALSAAGWQVYDRYLKANRVEAGTASYAQVVRLALGTRFGPEWTPGLRQFTIHD
ncbi:MAG: DUF3810 family protein [Acidobacteriota bacterium]